MIDWLMLLLHRYGDIGLFLYCLIGPLTYMPIGPDIFLIARAMACHCFPARAILLMVTAYTLSGTINFYIGQMASQKIKISSSWFRKVSDAISKYGTWSILLISLGPIPVREGAITIGFLKIPYKKFLFMMVLGTAIRFSAEGYFGARL